MSGEKTQDVVKNTKGRILRGGAYLNPVAIRSVGEEIPACFSDMEIATIERGRLTPVNGEAHSECSTFICKSSVLVGRPNVEKMSNRNPDVLSETYNNVGMCKELIAAQQSNNSGRSVEHSGMQDLLVMPNNLNLAASDEENASIDGQKSTRSCKIRNSYRIEPRRSSLPSCFLQLSVSELASMAYVKSSPRKVRDGPALNSRESYCAEVDAPNLMAVTPPPSYRSLVKQNLTDIPPSYESVTGLSLNVGQVCFH